MHVRPYELFSMEAIRSSLLQLFLPRQAKTINRGGFYNNLDGKGHGKCDIFQGGFHARHGKSDKKTR